MVQGLGAFSAEGLRHDPWLEMWDPLKEKKKEFSNHLNGNPKSLTYQLYDLGQLYNFSNKCCIKQIL